MFWSRFLSLIFPQIVVSACYFLARLFLRAPTSSHVDKEEEKKVGDKEEDNEEEGEEREEAKDMKEEVEKQEEGTPANTATDKILAAANLKVGLLLVSFS